jgi:hypothetical protein
MKINLFADCLNEDRINDLTEEEVNQVSAILAKLDDREEESATEEN